MAPHPHHPSYHGDFYVHYTSSLDILPDTFYAELRKEVIQKQTCPQFLLCEPIGHFCLLFDIS